MNSNIAKLIKLKNEPVAVVKSDTAPEGALQFKEGTWNCTVSMIVAASRGNIAALSEKTVGCNGGKAGTGLRPMKLGFIEKFLSTGEGIEREGEFYKKTPKLATEFVEAMPKDTPKEYLLLKPLSAVSKDETPECVVFLVNADQLSGLATLANYDKPLSDGVELRFGAGCSQALLMAMTQQKTCMVGMTDPSARKVLDKDLLSFAIPYARFVEMEENAEGSFLTKETWAQIAKRI